MRGDCLFLQADLDALAGSIEQLEQQMRTNRSAVGFTSEQSSESWHDNPMFDYNNREFDLLTKQHASLAQIMERAVVVAPPGDAEQVAIGTTVTLLRDDTQKQQRFSIGSYRVANSGPGAQRISYISPLSELILGARKGDHRKGDINGKPLAVTVVDIQLTDT
jgi:transcription elongation GreA/GreB family factor